MLPCEIQWHFAVYGLDLDVYTVDSGVNKQDEQQSMSTAKPR
jgi:hypothetical protein